MKKAIIYLSIGLMLGLSTNAFAAVSDSVQAVYAKFNYVVNGVAQPPSVTALVYDGTSYLRTTDLAIMLGYDVVYRADSRTIEFNKPSATPTPSIVPVPTTDLSVTPAPTGAVASPTPLPTDASGNVLPTPTPDPNATPTPTPTATITPSPTPTPAPSNVAACQAIRDSYGAQIAVLGQTEISQGMVAQKTMQLQHARDQALSSAGCN